MNIFDKLTARLNQVADLNGDGKVTREDLDRAVARLQEEAGDLVTRKGAFGACLICAGGGIFIGVVLAVVLKLGC